MLPCSHNNSNKSEKWTWNLNLYARKIEGDTLRSEWKFSTCFMSLHVEAKLWKIACNHSRHFLCRSMHTLTGCFWMVIIWNGLKLVFFYFWNEMGFLRIFFTTFRFFNFLKIFLMHGKIIFSQLKNLISSFSHLSHFVNIFKIKITFWGF